MFVANKSSISAKFLTKSGERNKEAINALKQTKTDPDALKKRQELNKRIAETRKKLESVSNIYFLICFFNICYIVFF